MDTYDSARKDEQEIAMYMQINKIGKELIMNIHPIITDCISKVHIVKSNFQYSF